ncbi:MAG: transglutaminase domain-containing protein, partial [Acidobacteriota bacterium]
DVRTPGGKSARSMRAAFFPHVEPGSILDLSYTVVEPGIPGFEYVDLQDNFPIRRLLVLSNGYLIGDVAWIPFFLGPPPPRAHASLDQGFDLDLVLSDLPPDRNEAYDPPGIRSGFALGLMPELISTRRRHPYSKGGVTKYGVLFGAPGWNDPAPKGSEISDNRIESEIDPSRGMAALDDLGLQVVPAWVSTPGSQAVMSWWNRVLENINKRFDKFFRHTSKAEGAADLDKIAPVSLPVKERVARLFAYVREKIHPDPEARTQKNLNRLLRDGNGGERDIALYLIYLLREAHIPARMVIALSRYAPTFQPILEDFRPYSPSYMVQVSPPGKKPIYLMPGDIFATVQTFPDVYLGALAFRQPDDPRTPWPMICLPKNLPLHGTTSIACSAALPVEGAKTPLEVKTTLTDNAAYDFRWRLGLTKPTVKGEMVDGKVVVTSRGKKVTDKWDKIYRNWMDIWTNIKPDGDLPRLDNRKDVEKPLTFAMKGAWNPGVRSIGPRLLVPAFPSSDIFTNPFQTDRRFGPIWWPNAGDYEISLSWSIPAPYGVRQLPKNESVKGPGGLFYTAAYSYTPGGKKGTAGTLKADLKLHLPPMLPASDYEAARMFCERLQRVSETRFLVDTTQPETAP